ncbi:MAG: hypothetical protein K6B75_01965, partial [Lachnospiraceae bacterium]|nr:hypothetical protein [Lachnospiraceae bacterium]
VTIDKGSAAIDMVSLFPAETYKGRENGLRKDLAEKLEALEPKFLRFPGGCVIEGISLELAYDWKDSIGVDENGDPILFNGNYGDVAARKLGQNLWTNESLTNDAYPVFMTYGLGFYEYFLLSEDIGAIGVPVLNCGIACMGQSDGQSVSVKSKEMQGYIQDALDLVKFCRGGADTKWGAVRIAMGHKEPFELKYIGIGNEQWGNEYFKHYEAFVDAFEEAEKENPKLFKGIELLFSSGPDDADSNNINISSYIAASRWLKANPDKTIDDYAGATDHHYYNDPDWFLTHTDYYDEANYSRTSENMTEKNGGGLKVFLGEYAARSNTWRAALAEAAYMTGLERNGDIVIMSCYAPLFGNTKATHWSPDLIWFNNKLSTCSVNYYVQQAFSLNAGTKLLYSELTGAEIEDSGLKGAVGVGTWNTAAKFGNIVITDNESGEILASDDFNSGEITSSWTKVSDGDWSVVEGELVQASISTNTGTYGNTGTAMYFGDTSLTNYTYTLEATKTEGAEGFLIPFSVQGKDNNFFWNIGGWNNTVSCLQRVTNGVKSEQLAGTTKDVKIRSGKTYKIKVVVTEENVKCYLNDVLYVDYDLTETTNAESYQVVSTDESGDIIVKLVNIMGEQRTYAVDLAGVTDAGLTGEADVYLVAGDSLGADNILGQTEVVNMETSKINGISSRFNYTVPKYSVTVLRIKRK